ncbi:MAG TPA: LysR family transcriptional regulator [Polyangia bacterium]|jgi:LysR family transcriptional activator of nhaA|nr:LysR family transcriptional regulator [Polyangia bacterium]
MLFSRMPMSVDRINFHHLYYFWAVAKDGNLTRTAQRLRVAQSALSAQIRQLEDQLGETLFARVGRRLVLTEAGGIALSYAEDIFAAGGELVSTLKQGRRREQVLSIGSVATLSRNFQESFIKPLLGQPDVRLRLESGGIDDLLVKLSNHALDIVLANRPPPREPGHDWRCHRVARQPVSLVGSKRRRTFRFPEGLRSVALIVPGPESDIRTEFDAICERLGLRPRIHAEVDDMAMMRLLARDTDVIAVVASVVVRDELRSRTLYEHCVVPGLFESFYAITVARRFRHPLIRSLLQRDEEDLMALGSEGGAARK